MNISINKILNVSWSFGVRVANSEKNEKDNPLYFSLKIVYGDNGAARVATVEMNLNQFYTFLNDLDSAKRRLDVIA